MEHKNKTIDIFGTKWKIKYVPHAYLDKEDKTTVSWGVTFFNKQIIEISLLDNEGDAFTEEQIELTLLHELMHAFLHEGQYAGESIDEPMVEWLAKCIRTVLRQKILK